MVDTKARKLPKLRAAVALSVFATSCTSSPPSPDIADSGIGSSGIGDSTTSTSSTQDGGGIRLDVAGSAAGDGCKKVDLLFVIDNSGSMKDEQENLVASFPGFIEGMRTKLAGTQGYHIGVIATDPYPGDDTGSTCDGQSGGMLLMSTEGFDSSERYCGPYSSGKRFMTEQDELEEKFSCIARVGTNGSTNERPLEMAIRALQEPMQAPGGCNEGFLRQDALLVVVIITDEEDDHELQVPGCIQQPTYGSQGEPSDWFNAFADIKRDESEVVVLSLVGPSDPAETCPVLDKCSNGIDGAEVAPRIIDFTERFTYGFVGSVCRPYGPQFAEALDVIVSACDTFAG